MTRPAGSTQRSLRLVCLPGTLCTGEVFAPMLAAHSTRQPTWSAEVVDYGAARNAHEAGALVEQRYGAPEHDIVLVGFSLGGIVAMQAALLLKHRLRALILIDVNGEADKPENAATRRAAVERAGASSLRAFVTETIWPTHVPASRQHDGALRESIVAMAEACGLEHFANQAEIAITRPRAIDRLAELSVPTLVLCGTHDTITPPALSRAIAAALPRGEMHLIDDAGHFAPLEQPIAMAAAIGPWLERLTNEDRVSA